MFIYMQYKMRYSTILNKLQLYLFLSASFLDRNCSTCFYTNTNRDIRDINSTIKTTTLQFRGVRRYLSRSAEVEGEVTSRGSGGTAPQMLTRLLELYGTESLEILLL